MTINQLDDGLKTLIKQHKNYQKRPLIIYSAVWPFLKIMKGKKNKIILDIFKVLTNLRSKNQDLLMPSFGNGYKDGIFNSDNEKSKNGILSEMFRIHPKSERTLSAFFSYNIL